MIRRCAVVFLFVSNICIVYPVSKFCRSYWHLVHLVVLVICVMYGSLFAFVVGRSFPGASPGAPFGCVRNYVGEMLYLVLFLVCFEVSFHVYVFRAWGDIRVGFLVWESHFL